MKMDNFSKIWGCHANMAWLHLEEVPPTGHDPCN